MHIIYPSFTPFQRMMPFGAKDLQNGEVWQRRNLCFAVIISRAFRQTWAFMTSDYLR